MVVLTTIGGVFVLAGAVICMIGGIGLLRMPNFFARAHAASVPDTLGAGLCLFGMILVIIGYDHPMYSWDLKALIAVKLFFIGAFLFFTSPIAGHAVCKAAFERGHGSDIDGSPHSPEEREAEHG